MQTPLRLASFRVGDGDRPAVLLHGFMGQGKNLRSLAQGWAQRDRSRLLWLPDLPGHGASAKVTEDTDLAAIGNSVLAAARAEGLVGPLELVGHSMGGRVALAASLASPLEVAQVTLLDITPAPISSETTSSARVLEVLRAAPESALHRREIRDYLTSEGLSQAIADWLVMNMVHWGDRYRWCFDREALGRLHPRLNREDLWPAVEREGAQVRCIRGGRSPYVPDADAARMERAGCEVITLDGAGHFLHIEGQQAVLALLVQGPQSKP